MGIRQVLYQLYESRLARALPPDRVPQHIGVILDGNRRWAKAMGATTAQGHRTGSYKIHELLDWCDEAGIDVVTLWLLSTDNLSRDQAEVDDLVEIIVTTVEELAQRETECLKLVGDLRFFGEDHQRRLRAAADSTSSREGMKVNIAIGYGGRNEIIDAVRSLIRAKADQGLSPEEIAGSMTDADIADHLYTSGQPDPDLVIRTSGEQRMSGFMLWQTVHTEFYFCEAYWPDFRRTDFFRALRDYAQRERRHGR